MVVAAQLIQAVAVLVDRVVAEMAGLEQQLLLQAAEVVDNLTAVVVDQAHQVL